MKTKMKNQYNKNKPTKNNNITKGKNNTTKGKMSTTKNQNNNIIMSNFHVIKKDRDNTKQKDKIAITQKDKNDIRQSLKDWLINIQQNEPLPYEITNVYFIVDFSNNDIELSYSASDVDLQMLDYGFYQPLEAEYFYCDKLKNLAKKMHQKKSKLSKKQIVLFFKELCFSVCQSLDFLKNTNIFVGERFEIIK